MALLDALLELKKSDMLPLHMPGHKRNFVQGSMEDILGIDITEIDGFDDLHNPEGFILDMEDKARGLYGADIALISVNGSTAANEAAIMAVAKAGDKILLSRASHKSIYYAVEICSAKPIYLEQNYIDGTNIVDTVSASQIEKALADNPDCHIVVITSPTYEGVLADIRSIANVVHSFGAVLIVDCAHGAHLGFSDRLPQAPIVSGADIVITSLHKTLPSPTQTALLLANAERVNVGLLKHYMKVFQSSSPSYVLMAGIGECLNYMDSLLPEDLERLLDRIERFKGELRGLKYIDVDSVPGNDPTKIVISSRIESISGYDIYHRLLEDFHIQCEMYSIDFCLAMLSVMDRDESFGRLTKALITIDSSIEKSDTTRMARKMDRTKLSSREAFPTPEVAMLSGEAIKLPSVLLPINDELVGRVSADYVFEYPPGIPIIIPGEIIDQSVITYINNGLEKHLNICGLQDNQMLVMENEQDNMPNG